MKKKNIWEPAALIAGIILTAGVLTVFRACGPKEDGTFMHCHTVQTDAALLGVTTVILALIAMLVKNRRLAAALHLAAAVLALTAILLPGTILPMCMMNTMRCHSVMKPFVRLLGALLLVLHGVSAAGALREGVSGGADRKA